MNRDSSVNKGSNTVLVVDDDDEIRDLLSAELELAELAVVTAKNGAEGVNKARTLKPDVILMDVMMPEMTGIEATRILKDDKETQHIPVIMVTSIDKKEDMIKGFAAGVTDYVTKPFFLPEIKARVKAILRQKNMFDDLVLVREQLVKEEMLKVIGETASIIQETVDDNIEFITNKLKYARKNELCLSEDDINMIENSFNNIKSTVYNLRFLDSFVFKMYETISGIVDKLR